MIIVATYFIERHEKVRTKTHPLYLLENITTGVLSLLLQPVTGIICCLVDVMLTDKNRHRIASGLKLPYGRKPVNP